MEGDGGTMNRENSEGFAPGGTGHANREKPVGIKVHEILEAQIMSGGHVKTKEESPCYGKTEPLKASGDKGDDLSDEDLDGAPIEQMGMVIDWLQRERVRLIQKCQARQAKGIPLVRKRKWGDNDSQRHSRRTNVEGDKTFRAQTLSLEWSRGSGGQNSRSKGSRVPKCTNCKKHHPGKCWEPPRCYRCREIGHTNANCPQLVPDQTLGSSSTTIGIQSQAGASQASKEHGGASVSNAPSVNQGRTHARVYTMTEAEARANPDSVAGITSCILVFYP
ncbi:unnamed protein product [Cuscuta epithymum]|uniref:CCHC-type domain-containing protein n=1 Tax=Cuscuta epithymum TaxID=186058 RepID=A0AAV0C524_9ASTE|nr:unnamed protein product [Cuscuta epithymum]